MIYEILMESKTVPFVISSVLLGTESKTLRLTAMDASKSKRNRILLQINQEERADFTRNTKANDHTESESEIYIWLA